MDESKRLRVLLDERGIEHKDNDTPINGVTSYMTTWHCTNGKLVSFIETEIPHATKLRIYNPTPEQAVAATVGVGTCTIVKTWTDSDYADHWRYSCSECGHQIEVGERDIATGNPTSHANFCWNCGRRIIEEETE